MHDDGVTTITEHHCVTGKCEKKNREECDSRIKWVLDRSEGLTKKAGQAKTFFTADLQLYGMGLNVQWANPELFVENSSFILGECISD